MARQKKKRGLTASWTRLPLAAGGAVARAAGSTGRWSLSKFMQAPAASVGVMALVGGAVFASSNALYMQPTEHPSPLFTPQVRAIESASAEPVVPLPAPRLMPQQDIDAIETSNIPAPPSRSLPDGPVGNEEVFALQTRLAELGLFDGEVDGYYGPKTARAIRAFETANGMTPRGELRRDIIEQILGAPPVPAPEPAALVIEPRAMLVAETEEAEEPALVIEVPEPEPEPEPLPEPVVSDPERVQLAAIEQPASELPPIAQQLGVTEPQTAAVVPAAEEVVIYDAPPVREETLVAEAPAEPTQLVDQVGGALNSLVDTAASLIPNQIASRDVPSPSRLPDIAVSTQPAAIAAPTVPVAPANDRELVLKVQRGLASLGFLTGAIDGVAGEGTSRAIRNFEIWKNLDVTGEVDPSLLDYLLSAGAVL